MPFITFYKCKKLISLKLIVRTMSWYHSTKTAKIWVLVISYTSRLIANFVPNFVATATGLIAVEFA